MCGQAIEEKNIVVPNANFRNARELDSLNEELCNDVNHQAYELACPEKQRNRKVPW